MTENNRLSRRTLLAAASAAVPGAMFAGMSSGSDPLPASAPAGTPKEVLSMKIRRSNDRGYADHGWLRSFHTFSFAGYHSPENMGFRALRVINDDTVEPARGFGTHPHNDMEIITYVVGGARIRPGDVQRMSAGTGVTHSEFNASKTDPVHFLQIWIIPDKRGYKPNYDQKAFPREERQGKLRLVASNDGREGSVPVNQDVSLYAGLFSQGEKATYQLATGRNAWVHVARGSIELNGTELSTGDAAAITEGGALTITGKDAAEVLVFDLA
jgi:redox-sensitive bicupin YhaK (pirin superfamily)